MDCTAVVNKDDPPPLSKYALRDMIPEGIFEGNPGINLMIDTIFLTLGI